MEASQNEATRHALAEWQSMVAKNPYEMNKDFRHSISYYFPNDKALVGSLNEFAAKIPQLIALVKENDFRLNLPRLNSHDAIGRRVDDIKHHPNYIMAGDIIYGSGMLKHMASPGGLLKSLCYFYLSSHAGEAGHNCPVACSAGIIRVLQKVAAFKESSYYLEKLTTPSYHDNFTGAQFITEIQGGSDVGLNQVYAEKDNEGHYRIFGEKWFCSNANADLILLSARFDEHLEGTKGLGLFLVPRLLSNGDKNHYQLNRLKEKLGTRTMASAEISFNGAFAKAVGQPDEGFKLLMENVLHLSRIYNSYACLGIMTQSYHIAYQYAKHRQAFGKAIIHYPLVIESLATMRAERVALMAFTMKTTALQDQQDCQFDANRALLLRLLANLSKYITAKKAVEHAHKAIDILGGNGAIESFSCLPRLLRDSIVCENWEGTHNTLRMQILRDLHKYAIDEVFFAFVKESFQQVADSEMKTELQGYFDKIMTRCHKFKQENSEMQQLSIKSRVNEWVYLGSAVCLLAEAEDERVHLGRANKLDCLKMFYNMYMTEKENQDLDLIRRLVGVDDGI